MIDNTQNIRGRLMAALLTILMLGLLLPGKGAAATADIIRSPNGVSSFDWYGFSQAGNFDFNGDGRMDWAVGAPFDDTGAPLQAGRVHVFLNGSATPAVADVIMTGSAVDDVLGYSVASAGDMNNDGYDDLIVGAIQASIGKVHVYFGGATPNNVADLTMTAGAGNTKFGYTVAGLGDVNGDGFDDVCIGAGGDDTGGTNIGRAFIYYGGATPNNVADLTITGEAAGDAMGTAVAAAGDVNDDGYDDFLVSAPEKAVNSNRSGRTYLYFGSATVNSVADLVVDGIEDQVLGSSLGPAGDPNGDGYADFLVGSPFGDANGTNSGVAHLLYGGPVPNATPDLTFTGGTGDSLGFAVTGVGDVDGDGYDDILVGAPGDDGGGTSAGQALLYLGGPQADATADLVLNGPSSHDSFGFSVTAAGDWNSDGLSEIGIGAYRHETNGAQAGVAFLYRVNGWRLLHPNGGDQWVAGRPATVRWLGRELVDIAVSADGGATWVTMAEDAGGSIENSISFPAPALVSDQALVRVRIAGAVISPSTTDVSDAVFRIVPPVDPPAAVHVVAGTLTGELLADQFGNAVAGVGDVNGDGYDDMLVGAPTNDGGGNSSGRAYLYFGGPEVNTTADLVMTGLSGDAFGTDLAGLGDINRDGFADFIINAPGNDQLGSSAGAAFVYLGGPGLDATADLTLLPLVGGDVFAAGVSGAGDINGDGFDDILVGAPNNDTGASNSGAVHVFFGGAAPDALVDQTFAAPLGGVLLGSSVAGGSDVNGDGHPDILAGALSYDAGGANGGGAFLFYGGPGADTSPDLVLTAEASIENFGYRVAMGDVDGDDHADLLVGAYLHDAANNAAGRAYLFLGGPGADDVADLLVTGDQDLNYVGSSVGVVGDINADGYGDFLVGAYGNSEYAGVAGHAAILYGGPGMDDVADHEIFGTLANENVGYAARAAGDINGDGFDDFLVGARQSGGGGPGKVLVVTSHRYVMTTPTGGDTWNVGAEETINWLGAEPANLWLSVDGGNSFSLLAEDLGGEEENLARLRVPHQPTRFARLRLTPVADLVGSATSDSLFTIEASIALLNLKAEPIEAGGVLLSWQTDPGPADLAGYRIDRSVGTNQWETVIPLTRETSYRDNAGRPGMRYRLSGINGLGQELLLGETGFGPLAALAAWPLPYRGGMLSVSFLTAGGVGGTAAPTDLSIFDINGRRIRTLVQGNFDAGTQTASWDGADDSGSRVPSGIYFLRATSGGSETRIKVTVLR